MWKYLEDLSWGIVYISCGRVQFNGHRPWRGMETVLRIEGGKEVSIEFGERMEGIKAFGVAP